MQEHGSVLQKCTFIIKRPHEIDPGAIVEPAAALARVDGDFASVLGPRQDPRQYRPSVVGLAERFESKFVAPVHEHAARLTRLKRFLRKVAELLLNELYLFDVVGLGALAERAEFAALLVAVD